MKTSPAPLEDAYMTSKQREGSQEEDELMELERVLFSFETQNAGKGEV